MLLHICSHAPGNGLPGPPTGFKGVAPTGPSYDPRRATFCVGPSRGADLGAGEVAAGNARCLSGGSLVEVKEEEEQEVRSSFHAALELQLVPIPPHHPVLWSELLHAPHVRTVLSRWVRRDLGNGGDICGGPSWGLQHAKREGTHVHWTGSREECQASDMSSRLGCLCWRGERTLGRQDVSQAGNLFLTCLAVSRPGFRHGICTGCQETEAVVLKRPATGSSPRQRVFVAGGVTIWRDRGRGAAVDFTGPWSVPVPGTALLRSGGCTHM